jgi:O-antigen/teichoic acid export membrane protein
MIVSGLILGNVLQPLWLLSGIEKVNESATIQMLNKLLSLPLILILIHNSLDLNKYFLINIFISFFVGICYLFWITYKYKINFKLVSVTEALDEIKQSSHLFFSLIFANLYTSLIPMVLGAFVSASSLGYYNLADRVRSLTLQLFHPVTHILFPKICFLIKSDPIKAKKLIIRSGLIVITISIFATFIVYFLAGPIILIISGSSFYNSINLLKILALTIPVMTLSEFLMYQYLIPIGNYDLQYRSRLFVFVLLLFFVFPTIVYNGNVGAAWLGLAMETLLIIYILFGIRGNLLNFLRKK